MSALHPPVKWAQRKDRIFITVGLRDIKEEKIELTEKSFSLSMKSDGKAYADSLNLFGEIVKDESKWSVNGLQLQIILFKKDKSANYWPRLTEENKKLNNITIDWSKYVDEDEEDQDASKGLNQDWDPDQMQNIGDEADSDDEDEGGNIKDLDEEQSPEKHPEDQNQQENGEKIQEEQKKEL